MSLPDDRLDQLLELKDSNAPAHNGNEYWHSIDGALVIFDGDDWPSWVPRDDVRDEYGNTEDFYRRRLEAFESFERV